MLENNLKGKRLPFPLKLYTIEGFNRVEKIFDNLDNLIIFIDSIKSNKLTQKMKISDICSEIGLEDTLTLVDERTEDIISNFLYFRSSATPVAPFDSYVWKQCVIVLEQMQPKLI